MIQGIYTASMAMTPLMDKQDQIANNLANIQTTGFKQSGVFIKTFQKYLTNDQKEPFVNSTIKTDQTYIDYSAGTSIKTDSPLDVYIQGNGFLTVMTQNGVRYTRNGNLSLDKDGFIVTSDGAKVLGKQGYIKIDDRYPVTIAESGDILQDGESKGVLRISDFPKPYNFVRDGNSYLQPASADTTAGEASNYIIRTGYLESSNVNVIQNMVSMIAANRNFEMDQKAVNAQDETLEQAVTQVGKIS